MSGTGSRYSSRSAVDPALRIEANYLYIESLNAGKRHHTIIDFGSGLHFFHTKRTTEGVQDSSDEILAIRWSHSRHPRFLRVPIATESNRDSKSTTSVLRDLMVVGVDRCHRNTCGGFTYVRHAPVSETSVLYV